MILKLIAAGITIFFVAIGAQVAINTSPYIYTKIYGNDETTKLYAVYEMANKKIPIKDIRNYLKNNKIENIVEHKEENLIAIHADTDGHGETVLIWYKNGVATGARFEHFL